MNRDSDKYDKYDLSAHFPDEPDQEDLDLKHDPRSSLWKWVQRGLLTVATLVCLGSGVLYLLSELAQQEPEFYAAALSVDEIEQRKQGSEMETRILDLRNSIMIAESWSAEFSEAQINGWLASDLQKKFPELIPNGISQPRVRIVDQSLTIAFKCRVKPFRGVAIIEAEIFMTGLMNQVGIRIKSVKSGVIPVPVAAFADQITALARKSGIEIQWDDGESDPVAIVDLPDKLIKPQDGSYIELESLQIETGRVTVSGKTHPPDF